MIEVLKVTKTTAEEVSEKLTIAAETEIKINTAREEFRPGKLRALVYIVNSVSGACFRILKIPGKQEKPSCAMVPQQI